MKNISNDIICEWNASIFRYRRNLKKNKKVKK